MVNIVCPPQRDKISKAKQFKCIACKQPDSMSRTPVNSMALYFQAAVGTLGHQLVKKEKATNITQLRI